VDNEVREAYDRLVTAFREGRWDDKFASFSEEATFVDGGRWFGSLDEYRTAWKRWEAEQDTLPVPLSVETRIRFLALGLHQARAFSLSTRNGEFPDGPCNCEASTQDWCSGEMHSQLPHVGVSNLPPSPVTATGTPRSVP
jgi:hypothetical protein